MVAPNSLHASMLSKSRSDPPGWITAVTPSRSPTSMPSRNGKNASLTMTAPAQPSSDLSHPSLDLVLEPSRPSTRGIGTPCSSKQIRSAIFRYALSRAISATPTRSCSPVPMPDCDPILHVDHRVRLVIARLRPTSRRAYPRTRSSVGIPLDACTPCRRTCRRAGIRSSLPRIRAFVGRSARRFPRRSALLKSSAGRRRRNPEAAPCSAIRSTRRFFFGRKEVHHSGRDTRAPQPPRRSSRDRIASAVCHGPPGRFSAMRPAEGGHAVRTCPHEGTPPPVVLGLVPRRRGCCAS